MGDAITPQRADLPGLAVELQIMILRHLVNTERHVRIHAYSTPDANAEEPDAHSAPPLFTSTQGICRASRAFRSHYSSLLQEHVVQNRSHHLLTTTLHVLDLDFSLVQSAYLTKLTRYMRLGWRPHWQSRISLEFTPAFARNPSSAGLQLWLATAHISTFRYECVQIGEISRTTRPPGTYDMSDMMAVVHHMNAFNAHSYGRPGPELAKIHEAVRSFLLSHYRASDPVGFDLWVGGDTVVLESTR